ncbi:hypothetical protein SOPP22_10840 [Shewanella sp. OPT22]|nr:hypothetical protein SOPP22_10840 [Shewanella sp. OPT22]
MIFATYNPRLTKAAFKTFKLINNLIITIGEPIMIKGTKAGTVLNNKVPKHQHDTVSKLKVAARLGNSELTFSFGSTK